VLFSLHAGEAIHAVTEYYSPNITLRNLYFVISLQMPCNTPLAKMIGPTQVENLILGMFRNPDLGILGQGFEFIKPFTPSFS